MVGNMRVGHCFAAGSGDGLAWGARISPVRRKRRLRYNVARVQKSERRNIDEATRCQKFCSGSMFRPPREMLTTRPTISLGSTGGSKQGSESPRVIR